jgi:hypothetical protein
MAGLLVVAGCSRPADSRPALEARHAPQSAGAVAAASQAPGSTAPPPGGAAPGRVTEATCATAPLGVRVVSVRRETPDSIRVELALANLAAADAFGPGSGLAAAAQAAVDALDRASVLSADGRRRMFALRGGSGARVGSPVTLPGPGRTATFWTLFPAAEGEVTVLLPGFTPLAGLTVVPGPGQPEP